MTILGTLALPPTEGAFGIGSSPFKESIPIRQRNICVQVTLATPDAPADIIAAPTFPAGADGQEIAVCNTGKHPLIFHDSRRGGGPQTTLVLDCEPGGTLSLDAGQIMMLYYSTATGAAMNHVWTQRGAIATSVPVLLSLTPTMASAAGGESITITGRNLSSDPKIFVGSSPPGFITPTEITETFLKFRMPARSAGTHYVLVKTGRGASNILSIKVQ